MSEKNGKCNIYTNKCIEKMTKNMISFSYQKTAHSNIKNSYCAHTHDISSAYAVNYKKKVNSIVLEVYHSSVSTFLTSDPELICLPNISINLYTHFKFKFIIGTKHDIRSEQWKSESGCSERLVQGMFFTTRNLYSNWFD